MSQKLDHSKNQAPPGGRSKTPDQPLKAVGNGRQTQASGVLYDGPALVASEGGVKGKRLVRQSGKQDTGLFNIAEMESQRRSDSSEAGNKGLVEAYNPELYEQQMKDNGHSDAQAAYVLGNARFIGERVVSVGCGPAWLDRELVKAVAQGRLRRRHLTILGIDTLPANIEHARRKMEETLDEHPSWLRQRVSYQYMLANLEGPQVVRYGREKISVPDLAQIDLRDTVIGAKHADTFMIYMVFMWLADKARAVRAISEKCRPAKGEMSATHVINGEEYPVRITPGNPNMTESFVRGFLERVYPISLNRLWGEIFTGAGLVGLNTTQDSHSFHIVDDHTMRHQVFEYLGSLGYSTLPSRP